MKSRRPKASKPIAPLRAADGRLFHFAPGLNGGLCNDNGEVIHRCHRNDMDKIVPAMPFKSVLCRRWPAVIYTIWVVDPDQRLPLPDFVMTHFAEVNAAGGAILLLATDGSARNQVKQTITAMLGMPSAGCA